MDNPPDLGIPSQSPLQQTQQSSTIPQVQQSTNAQQPGNVPANTQQQATQEPQKKEMPWWGWVIIAVFVIAVISGASYYFFSR